MLPGETLADKGGTQFHKCEDCGKELIPRVLHSAAGYYVGTACNCGPYSRESGYYATREIAATALDESNFERT